MPQRPLAIDEAEGRLQTPPRAANGAYRGQYGDQLSALSDTYEQIRKADLSALTNVLAGVRRRQATYVGSGGALGIARFAAELHEVRTRSFARAATPLELIGTAPVSDSAVVLFSAGARHPDAAAATTAALRSGAYPVVLVTHRNAAELPPVFSEDVQIITLPGLSGREGFLATNSVLAMASAVVAASGFKLPPHLPHFRAKNIDALRDQTMILSGPKLSAVATDLETRLSETGLSAAQVTDYRNFAHGRHTGLLRRLNQTTVLALVNPEIKELADKTLSLLPDDAHIARLATSLRWPTSTLDLLVASMKAITPSAEATNLDPARPRVPRFGRRLYHLSSRRMISPAGGPVDRKLSSLRVGGPHQLRRRYEKAAHEWLQSFREQRFRGFVFDYDGTVCATDARFDLPSAAVQDELRRLLEGGAVIGFASGRGRSIHRDLREWLPRPSWSCIELGLYNGGLLTRLDEDLDDASGRNGPIHEAYRRMRENPLSSFIVMEEREHQLAITPVQNSGLALDALAQMAQETISVPPALLLKVAASGHSVDVVPADSAKTKSVQRVRARAGGSVVAFGDQGQVGGNDFELLAETRWSLSVDKVSGDPSRCWNLDERGERGPEVLHRYLRGFQRLRDGFAFRPAR